jgi:hypothetical protein
MNLSNRPDLKALKQLLEEVGHANLFYRIVQSKNEHDLKSNVHYAVKTLGQKMDNDTFQKLLVEARRNALNVSQPDARAKILSLIDGLQKTNNPDTVFEQMTNAFLNKNKNYSPVMRNIKKCQKSKAKKHSRFDFSSMTAKALRRA